MTYFPYNVENAKASGTGLLYGIPLRSQTNMFMYEEVVVIWMYAYYIYLACFPLQVAQKALAPIVTEPVHNVSDIFSL